MSNARDQKALELARDVVTSMYGGVQLQARIQTAILDGMEWVRPKGSAVSSPAADGAGGEAVAASLLATMKALSEKKCGSVAVEPGFFGAVAEQFDTACRERIALRIAHAAVAEEANEFEMTIADLKRERGVVEGRHERRMKAKDEALAACQATGTALLADLDHASARIADLEARLSALSGDGKLVEALRTALVAMRLASALPGVSDEFDFADAIQSASATLADRSSKGEADLP